MDSHLLVVSGVSSCWRSGCSEAEMNPGEGVATRRVTSRLFSDGYHNKDNQQILRTHQHRIQSHSITSTGNSELTLTHTKSSYLILFLHLAQTGQPLGWTSHQPEMDKPLTIFYLDLDLYTLLELLRPGCISHTQRGFVTLLCPAADGQRRT